MSLVTPNPADSTKLLCLWLRAHVTLLINFYSSWHFLFKVIFLPCLNCHSVVLITLCWVLRKPQIRGKKKNICWVGGWGECQIKLFISTVCARYRSEQILKNVSHKILILMTDEGEGLFCREHKRRGISALFFLIIFDLII